MSIEEKFFAAVDVVNNIPYDGTFEPSNDIMLKFYAYLMQATEGPCCETKPYIWNAVARHKWNAWNELGDMSSQIAMEKYIEELSKVVETMSYNEYIAKFLSLMGSFYEIVSSEECEPQSDKKNFNREWTEDTVPSVLENYESPTISDIYRISRKEGLSCNSIERKVEKFIEYSARKTSLNSQMTSGSHVTSRNCPEQRFSQSSFSTTSSDSCSDNSHFDLLSDLSDNELQVTTGEHRLHILQNKQTSCASHCRLPRNDLLVLKLMIAQNSMKDILEKMENLNSLAREKKLERNQFNPEPEKESDFSMNWTGTAFALLWPIVVEFILE